MTVDTGAVSLSGDRSGVLPAGRRGDLRPVVRPQRSPAVDAAVIRRSTHTHTLKSHGDPDPRENVKAHGAAEGLGGASYLCSYRPVTLYMLTLLAFSVSLLWATGGARTGC
jgi:hypothetical protein